MGVIASMPFIHLNSVSAASAPAAPTVKPAAPATVDPNAPPFYPVSPEDGELDLISKVTDRLFLANWRGADDLKKRKELGITHIAAVGSEFMGDSEDGVTYWSAQPQPLSGSPLSLPCTASCDPGHVFDTCLHREGHCRR